MTVGSIPLPQIIPLRNRPSGPFQIDTNTLIEIHCNRSDVDIYYTLDGAKPDTLATLASRKSTIEYFQPFCVPREIGKAGKVTIKAVAVARDGLHESSVATRTFQYHHTPSDHSASAEEETQYLHQLQQQRQVLLQSIEDGKQLMQRRSSESLHRSVTDSFQSDQQHPSPRYADSRTKPIRCAHCSAPKTNDPYTRFCTDCGRSWQKLTQNKPKIPTVRTCARCSSAIPFNYDTCAVCEMPCSVDYQPPVHVPTQAKILCPQCKTANPTHHQTCSICQSKLLPTLIPSNRASVSIVSPRASPDGSNICVECGRSNRAEARFCQGCGTQRKKASFFVPCSKCRTQNDSSARFCSACGCVMEIPLRAMDGRLRQDSMIPSSAMIASTMTHHSGNPRWLSAQPTLIYDRQAARMHQSEAATQTYGIYYPNAKDLDLVISQNQKLQAEREFPKPTPKLTAATPGHGYWKKQIDHVYTQLQAYAADRAEFRSLLGEPPMGKMVHANVQHDEQKVTLQVVFSKPENPPPPPLAHARNNKERYSMANERAPPFSSQFDSDDEYSRDKTRRRKPKPRPHSASGTGTDQKLNQTLAEILERRPPAENRKSSSQLNIPEEVRRLLKKGADANGRNNDNFTMLQLAVRNRHNECLEILIRDGHAKLDKKGGPRGNTALHECCLLGPDGVEPLRILLKNGGEAQWINERNESVVDLANKQSCPELMKVLALYRDQQRAEAQSNTHSSGSLRKSPTTTDGYRLSGKA